MGYTHYWKKNKKVGEKEWSQFKKFVSNLVNAVNDGKEVENSAGGGKEIVVIKGGDGTGKPVINDEVICFNGDKSNDLDHETLYIGRSNTDGFNFCKTNRKPYDPVVIACLIEAERLGIIDEWSSDGDEGDHKGGIKLHRSIVNPQTGEELTFSEVIEDICRAFAELSGTELAEIAERYVDKTKYEYNGDDLFIKSEK